MVYTSIAQTGRRGERRKVGQLVSTRDYDTMFVLV